ncbi:MAG: GAF domain-containing SpoIIE family protein phosphatase [Acidobacteriota bacterium]
MINPAALSESFNDLDHVLRIEELYLLQRVAQKINSILDLDALLDQIVEDVAETFGYTRLAVLLKDEDTDELVIAAGWAGELCLKGTRYQIGEKDGMSGHAAATASTFYAPDVQKVPFYIAGEEDTRSELDIPLKVRGDLIGIFNLQQTCVDGFTPERIRLLEALAGHVSTAIANARLYQRERDERDRMSKELDEARAIQSGLFPGECPAVDGFEITGICIPCREVGGDWFDYIQLGGGRIGIVLGDVSGKGSAAAFLMSSARSILRMNAQRFLSPGKVLAEVNKILIADFPSARFVTLIYAVVDPASRSVTFANGGHVYPLIVEDNGARFLETESGLPLGIMESEYSERRIDMPVGSKLFLYTDGITEAVNTAGDEYGDERIMAHAAKPEASVSTLYADVARFSAGVAVADDITVVMLGSI